MPQLNSAMYTALRADLYTGSVNDMLVAMLKAQGATGSDLSDLWRSFFIQELSLSTLPTGNLVDQHGGVGGNADKGAFKLPDILGANAITSQNDRDFSDENIGNWLKGGSDSGTCTYDSTNLSYVNKSGDDKQGLLTAVGDGTLWGYLSSSVMTIAVNTLLLYKVKLAVPAGNTLKDVTLYINNLGVDERIDVTLDGDTWVEVELYKYAAADITGEFRVMFDGNPAIGDLLYFKDISVKPADISWVPYGANKMEIDADVGNGGALKITWVDDEKGALIFLRSSNDLISDLTIGEKYLVQFNAKVNLGTVEIEVYDGTAYHKLGALTNSLANYEFIITATSATACAIRFDGMSADEIVWINTYSVERVSAGIYTFNDLAMAYLTSVGFVSGSLNDRWLQFWVAGGVA
jgi:hypothetical protein